MINEITVRPKAKNKKAHVICLLFLLLAAAVTVVYLMVDTYRGAVGLGAAAMIAAAIYVYTKYIGNEYSYDVVVSNGTPLFLVRQTVGRRSTLLLNIHLSSIREVRRESRDERRMHKAEADVRRYVFTPTVFPSEVYRIISAGIGERCEIIIECTEDFASLLMRYAEEARAAVEEE